MIFRSRGSGVIRRIVRCVIAVILVSVGCISRNNEAVPIPEPTPEPTLVPPDMDRLGLPIIAVAAGVEHSLALKDDGTVWAWGNNRFGQLGDAALHESLHPTQVPDLTNVTAIDAGRGHNMALIGDGTVWTWGLNRDGQLGIGTTQAEAVPTPTQVPGLTNVTAIAAGADHSMALREDGRVWVWGANNFGQLGIGTTIRKWLPTEMPGVRDVIDIATSSQGGAILKGDRTVWVWGWRMPDLDVELVYVDLTSPVQVTELTDITAIAVGATHTMALRGDGTVWAWGQNGFGEIAQDPGSSSDIAPIPIPAQIVGLTDIYAIEAGHHYSLALQENGTLWVWGSNLRGELGDGTAAGADRFEPGIVPLPARVVAIDASAHTLAILEDGTIWGWGDNSSGQLSGEITTRNILSPIQIASQLE